MANISSKSNIVVDAAVQQTVYTQFIKVARKAPDDNLVLHGASFKKMASDAIPIEISDADLEKSSFPHSPLSRRMIGILGERKSEPGISVYFRSADVIKKVYAALVERDVNRDGKIDDAFASQDLEINLEEYATASASNSATEANDEAEQTAKLKRINAFLKEYEHSVFSVAVMQNDSASIVQGTGFLVDKTRDGKGGFDYLVMTNAHVVENTWMDQVQSVVSLKHSFGLTTYNGNLSFNDVQIVGTDPLRDIAVLKFNSPLDLTVPPLGKSADLVLLEEIVSYGNSLGEGLRPDIGKLLDHDYYALDNITQLSLMRAGPMAIQGNSGGPVFNTQGEVVGIVDAVIPRAVVSILPYQDSFLISIENALYSLQMIKNGNVQYGDWGIYLLPLGQAELDAILPKDLPRSGTQVTKVSSNGAAAEAGIQSGDVIVSVDGDSTLVTVSSGQSQNNKFYNFIRWLEKGDNAVLKIYRPATQKTFETTIVTQSKSFQGSNIIKSKVGLFVQDVSLDLRELYSIRDDINGVLVVKDSSKSPEDLNKRIITKVNGVPVADSAAFVKALDGVQQSGKKTVTLTVVETALDEDYALGGVGAQRLVTLPIE